VKDGKRLVLFVKDGGDGFENDHAAWVDPVLRGPKGELKLTELKWTSASAGWGEPRVNRTCENRQLTVNGQQVTGIGTHSESSIIYDLPEGYDTFSVRGVVTRRGSVVFGVLVDRGTQKISETSEVSVKFSDLGITGAARVRDLWSRQDLGVFTNSFGRELPLHGAGLYRIAPMP
jgi:hypothetical protein